jgi:hypothetical protein
MRRWGRGFSGMVIVIRLFIGTLGRKPGQDRLLAMLLQSSDLPRGDWRVANQRTHRTGAGRASTNEVRRARKEKSITAWRCIMSDSARRSLSSSVTPYATSSDAESSLRQLIPRLIRKPFSKLNISGERIVDGREVPGLPDALIYEEQTAGPNGPGGTRIVAGTIEKILFVMDFSSLGELWPWDEVTSITALQVAKIQSTVSDD